MLHWFLSLSTRVPVPSMHSNGLSLSVPRIPFRSAVARHTGSLLSDGNPVYSSAEFLNMMTVSTGYPEQTRAPFRRITPVFACSSSCGFQHLAPERVLWLVAELWTGHCSCKVQAMPQLTLVSKSFLSSSLFPGSTTVCSRHSSGALTRFWMRLLASQRALDRSRYLFLRLPALQRALDRSRYLLLRLPASQRALGSFRYLLLRLLASQRALDRSRYLLLRLPALQRARDRSRHLQLWTVELLLRLPASQRALDRSRVIAWSAASHGSPDSWLQS